ncbi:hypothetical protein KBB76_01420 [Candidatus Saccharibacteria bacterium]|jgi:uncharacterized protein with PQ loop repeat|nr:hypothetical protein [Candidatus Saccharibacteria bacterium]HOR23535.1 hypothetical protein [Candidatus Saccharibacteria bacterium]
MYAVLLMIAGFIAVLCSIPQFFQLLKKKRSDEFNLFSWSVWATYQVFALLYTMSVQAHAYSVINSLWIVFYSIMIFLIIKYRVKPSKKKVAVKTRKYRVN